MKKTEYGAGRRFAFMRGLSLALNSCMVFGFYFIYRYLFESMAPNFVGWPMALVFLAAEVGVVKATLWVMEKYRAGICCRVTPDCLIVGAGKTERRYYWKDFTKADLGSAGAYRFGTVLPIRFFLGEQTLELNQYLADIYGLAGDILEKISPYAEIPPELEKQVQAMRGVL